MEAVVGNAGVEGLVSEGEGVDVGLEHHARLAAGSGEHGAGEVGGYVAGIVGDRYAAAAGDVEGQGRRVLGGDGRVEVVDVVVPEDAGSHAGEDAVLDGEVVPEGGEGGGLPAHRRGTRVRRDASGGQQKRMGAFGDVPRPAETCSQEPRCWWRPFTRGRSMPQLVARAP